RVIFAGDSAHIVSPFGARGGNGGIQDVDNLVWKLAMVIRGEAPQSLIETYEEERAFAADENIRHTASAHDFMTPKSELERVIRGEAPQSLIETYDEERAFAADENIRHSARATAFMTPKTEMERVFRDSVLALAERHDFARRLVNSGRLSKPCLLEGMSLQTP